MTKHPSRAGITGPAGILVWTSDLPRLTAFYRDVLGLVPHTSNDHLTSFVWGNFKLNLSPHPKVHGKAKDPFRIMLNLMVADIHATHAVLERRGATFMRPPEEEGWGGWIATFTDPDGNILQLLQPAALP